MPATPTSVRAQLECRVTAAADLVFSVAVAHGPALTTEHLACTLDGRPLALDEVGVADGGRLHRGRAVPPGDLVLDYRAEVAASPGEPATLTDADAVTWARPSRYCESDRLGVVAGRLFEGLAGRELLDAVVAWVETHTRYVPGTSGATDGALDTYLAGQGVCRDYAHLVIALLRARGVPARLASVYAPGLAPMDFHAVVEAAVDGRWQLVDATRLAPRPAMVRIATGRDAADTAFLTVLSGLVDFRSLGVTAVAGGALPADDGRNPVFLEEGRTR